MKIRFIALAFFLLPFFTYSAYIPEGVVVKSPENEKVFFIEESKKRWVASPEAFEFHGFDWEKILEVSGETLASYVEGDVLAVTDENVVLAGEEAHLPDLVPFPASDLFISYRLDRRILKFTSTFFNQGRGQLEIIGKVKAKEDNGDIDQDVYQRIANSNGDYRDKLVGSFLWHDDHEHYHFSDFGEFTFAPVGDKDNILSVVEKTTRCIWDTEAIALDLNGAPQQKEFRTCKNKDRQGISVGWGDIYDYTLADQYLDIHDLPSGIYTLTLTIDPRNLFVEGSESNNESIVLVKLDAEAGTVQTLASTAPFSHPYVSRFPNEMLVRAEGDDKIFVIYNNKKRLLRNSEILSSYNYNESEVYEFPKAIIDAIPFNNLVRVDGTKVYALNDAGYKRHIQNPEIFVAYNLDWNDVADISQEEFREYADTRVIRVAGLPEVYYEISGDSLLSLDYPNEFESRGFTLEEVQVIIKDDFELYKLLIWTNLR